MASARQNLRFRSAGLALSLKSIDPTRWGVAITPSVR